jgi:hypothetical protein
MPLDGASLSATTPAALQAVIVAWSLQTVCGLMSELELETPTIISNHFIVLDLMRCPDYDPGTLVSPLVRAVL